MPSPAPASRRSWPFRASILAFCYLLLLPAPPATAAATAAAGTTAVHAPAAWLSGGVARMLTTAMGRRPTPDREQQGTDSGRRPADLLPAGTTVRTDPAYGTPRRIRFAAPFKPVRLPQGALREPQRAAETVARAFLRDNGILLRLRRPLDELVQSWHEQDDLGFHHIRYRQQYRGIPVWPAALTLHLDGQAALLSMDGRYAPTPERLVTTPAVPADQARQAALEAAGAPDGTSADPPELIIYMPAEGGPLRLAWKTRVRLALDTVLLTVIDAATGAVLTQYNEVTRANVQGQGTDLTGKRRTINVWEASGTYYLVDTSKDMYDAAASQPPEIAKTKGAFIVLDAHNRPPTNNPQRLETESLTQITASSPNGPWLADGVGVSWALSAVYDFYKQRFNWTSYDNQGGTLTAVVRLGQNYANAFMATDMKLMAFGDADHYATLDIIGHEFQHGVTGSTARLVYRDQSGAINEALSDIFGELIQDFATGSTDWTSGTDASDAGVKRSMKEPHAHTITGLGPYPASMREYYRVDFDNGGVHINHTIISHAFYLLAEGLDDPAGKLDAGRIFFRALRYHLTQNAQFVDVRLACVAAAEEIWAADTATRDRMIARIKEAFDRVEVLEAAATPKAPAPRQPVQGSDALVYVASYYDDWGFYQGDYLAACENGSCQWLSQYPVRPSRPAVSGDGSLALFVNKDYDLCMVPTDGQVWEECLGYSGTVASVAMSPDATRFAFVLLDPLSGEPEDKITVLTCQADGSSCSDPKQYNLMAPVLDGGFAVDLVAQADALAFSGDGRYLFYDAYNVLSLKDGSKVGAWSIYALDLATERVFSVVPPAPGIDTGFPALARTTDHVMVFDAYDPATDRSAVTVMDLETGTQRQVATVPGQGIPGFNGDDTLVVYTNNGAIYARALTGFIPSGEPSLQKENAAFGVVFRRGTYTPPAPELSVTPQGVDFGDTPVGGTTQKTLTLGNTGTADLQVTGLAVTGTDKAAFQVLPGGCIGQTLRPGGNCVVRVVFSPQGGGSMTASLAVSSTAAAAAANVPLSGTAVPQPPGDTNQDNKADLADALRTLRFLTGGPAPAAFADANGDRRLGLEEAAAALRAAGQGAGSTGGGTTGDGSTGGGSTGGGSTGGGSTDGGTTGETNPPPVSHTITATTEGSGTIAPAGTVTVTQGADKTFTATPAAGNHLVDLVVDGVSQGAQTTYTFTNVQADHTIVARFAPDQPQAGSISEQDLLGLAFGGKADLADMTGELLEVTARAVWTASELTGSPTFTGTLTQQSTTTSFTYTPSPQDRLVVRFSTGKQLEIRADTSRFTGYTDGTVDDFLLSHQMAFTITGPDGLDLQVSSTTTPGEPVDAIYTQPLISWQRQIRGVLPVATGLAATVDLTITGSLARSDPGASRIFSLRQERVKGTATVAGASITVDSASKVEFSHDANTNIEVYATTITVQGMATSGADTYTFDNCRVFFIKASSMNPEAATGFAVSEAEKWQVAGTVRKNGQVFGTLQFDKQPTSGDPIGPAVVLKTATGNVELLRTIR